MSYKDLWYSGKLNWIKGEEFLKWKSGEIDRDELERILREKLEREGILDADVSQIIQWEEELLEKERILRNLVSDHAILCNLQEESRDPIYKEIELSIQSYEKGEIPPSDYSDYLDRMIKRLKMECDVLSVEDRIRDKVLAIIEDLLDPFGIKTKEEVLADLFRRPPLFKMSDAELERYRGLVRDANKLFDNLKNSFYRAIRSRMLPTEISMKEETILRKISLGTPIKEEERDILERLVELGLVSRDGEITRSGMEILEILDFLSEVARFMGKEVWSEIFQGMES